MKDYADVTCGKAVTNMKQKLRDWKKRAYDNLSRHYLDEVTRNFLNQHQDLMEAVNKRSTVANLERLEQFVNPAEVEKKWYKDEYRRSTPTDFVSFPPEDRLPSSHNTQKKTV